MCFGGQHAFEHPNLRCYAFYEDNLLPNSWAEIPKLIYEGPSGGVTNAVSVIVGKELWLFGGYYCGNFGQYGMVMGVPHN